MKCDDEALDKFKDLRKTLKEIMVDEGSIFGPTFSWYYLNQKTEKVDFRISHLPDETSFEERKELMDGIRGNFKKFIFSLIMEIQDDIGEIVPLGYGVNIAHSIITGDDKDFEWYANHREIRNHPNKKTSFISIFVGYGGVVKSIMANVIFEDEKVIGFEEDIERPGIESIFIIDLGGDEVNG